MKKNKLKFNIGSIFEREEGANIKAEFDDKVSFSDDVLVKPVPLKASFMFMKLNREINVTAMNVETETGFTCSRCLEKFVLPIRIPIIERQFLYDKPHGAEDLDDLYLVDVKTTTIDLNELMRQEILLHFPIIPLCSSKCKGLCVVCGKNLNKGKCQHMQTVSFEDSAEETIMHKPLSQLKDLLITEKHGKTTSNQKKSPTKSDTKKIQRIQKKSPKTARRKN